MYDLIIQSPDDSTVFHPPYDSITIKEELNKGYDGSFTISYPSIKKYADAFGLTPDDIFATSSREWYVRKNEVKIFGGILMDRRISGGATGLTSLVVNIADFSLLLNKRRTDVFWQRLSTDSADIVEDMLDYTNAISPTGIVMGNKPVTKNRDQTSRYANIRDEIVSMSALKKYDGYDWDVDVTKSLNLYYPKGEVRGYIILDEFNTTSFQNNRNLQGKLTNKVYVLGKGYDDDMVVGTKESVGSQTTWGLLEDVLSEKGVGTLSELEDRGEQFVNDNAFSTDGISLKHQDGTPDLTSYSVGDTVRAIRRDLSYDEELRVYKRTIQIDDSGGATVDLSFE